MDSSVLAWFAELHGNRHTFGKVLKVLGEHDFLVLDTKDRYIKVTIRDGDDKFDIMVEAVYFSSLNVILDGYFHHFRSLYRQSSNFVHGFVHWYNGFIDKELDYTMALLRHYTNLGLIKGVNNKLDNIIEN